MAWWRQDLSTLGFIIAFLAAAAGWLLTFTQLGANLIVFGAALAVGSALICPTRRRFMAAAVVVAGIFWIGIALASMFVAYEVIRASRRTAHS